MEILLFASDPVLIFMALCAGYACRRWWWAAPVAGFLIVLAYQQFGQAAHVRAPSDELSVARWIIAGVFFALPGLRLVRRNARDKGRNQGVVAAGE
jgi:hypothetical protein